MMINMTLVFKSESVRKIIEEYQPRLNLCGHIHEARAFDMIDNTVVVNPGILEEGFACLIEIAKKKGLDLIAYDFGEGVSGSFEEDSGFCAFLHGCRVARVGGYTARCTGIRGEALHG